MSPQHTIPNVNTGELTQVEMGKEPIPNLYVREKNAANRMVEENIAPIQLWGNKMLHSLTMVVKTQLPA